MWCVGWGSGLDMYEAREGVGCDVRDGWGCGLHKRMAECQGMTCRMGETVWTHVRYVEGVLAGGGWQPEHVGCIATSPSHARLSQNQWKGRKLTM